MYARWDRGYIAPSTLLWIVREEELCVGWAGANQPLDIASSANHTLQRIPQIRPLIRQYFRALLELHQCCDFETMESTHRGGREKFSFMQQGCGYIFKCNDFIKMLINENTG